jgi:hypothetical protein
MFLWRHAGWGIGILVAALIGPAIAKQWSDRNQELSLKNDLVAGLSTSVATAFRARALRPAQHDPAATGNRARAGVQQRLG